MFIQEIFLENTKKNKKKEQINTRYYPLYLIIAKNPTNKSSWEFLDISLGYTVNTHRLLRSSEEMATRNTSIVYISMSMAFAINMPEMIKITITY